MHSFEGMNIKKKQTKANCMCHYLFKFNRYLKIIENNVKACFGIECTTLVTFCWQQQVCNFLMIIHKESKFEFEILYTLNFVCLFVTLMNEIQQSKALVFQK